MFCVYCGTNNSDDAGFCPTCGNRLKGAENPPASSTGSTSSQVSEMPIGTGYEQPSVGYRPVTQQPLSRQSNVPTQPHPYGPYASSPMSALSRQNLGFIIAGVAGLLGLLAFFFMPYVSYGPFSLSGQQLASAGTSLGGQYNSGLLQLLWLEPLVAVIFVGIAGYWIYTSQKRTVDKSVIKPWSLGLSILAGLTVLILLGRYAIDAQPIQTGFGNGLSLASFYGSGIWIYLISMIGALAGGIVQYMSP